MASPSKSVLFQGAIREEVHGLLDLPTLNSREFGPAGGSCRVAFKKFATFGTIDAS